MTTAQLYLGLVDIVKVTTNIFCMICQSFCSLLPLIITTINDLHSYNVASLLSLSWQHQDQTEFAPATVDSTKVSRWTNIHAAFFTSRTFKWKQFCDFVLKPLLKFFVLFYRATNWYIGQMFESILFDYDNQNYQIFPLKCTPHSCSYQTCGLTWLIQNGWLSDNVIQKLLPHIYVLSYILLNQVELVDVNPIVDATQY